MKNRLEVEEFQTLKGGEQLFDNFVTTRADSIFITPLRSIAKTDTIPRLVNNPYQRLVAK